MRFLLISLLAVLLVNIVQAQDYFDTTDDYKEEFKGEKVTLGKKKCTCSFMLEVDGDKCSGKGGCDKKCSGSGSVEIGRYSFTLKVKKGKATISKCKAEVESTPLPTTGGSGSGEEPITMPPAPGSGSGEEPITMPPAPGSGSGPGPSPPMGEGMQCRCKCNCPDGSGECDCDCNCPMQSTAMTCASGFTRVCPMVEDACPEDMDMICPMNAASRMGGAEADGTVKGCQCVPDFLMSLVSPGMPPAAVRLGATDREAVEASIKVGKTQCKCSFDMAMDGLSCKKSKGRCDKKCNGAAKGVELMDGMYMLDMKVKKGKVTIAKCEVTPIALTGTGTGSGTGSGEGAGGMGGMGSRCACVGKGMGGSGPPPPTGSGSGPVPPTGGPVLPTGGPMLPTGGPVLPTEGPVPPTGTGSGSGTTPTPQTVTIPQRSWAYMNTSLEPTLGPVGVNPYQPGTPGSPWTEDEVLSTRLRILQMIHPNWDIKEAQGTWNGIGVKTTKGQVTENTLMRLVFHDCMRYTDGTGGCDGCINWKGVGESGPSPHDKNDYYKTTPFNRTDNNGMDQIAEKLELIYTTLDWPFQNASLEVSLSQAGRSRADLWELAGLVALERTIERANRACDLDFHARQQVTLLESRQKCEIKLTKPLKFLTGRKDCIPDPDLPGYMAPMEENQNLMFGDAKHVIDFGKTEFGIDALHWTALQAIHGVVHSPANLGVKYTWFGPGYLSNVYFKMIANKPRYRFDQGGDLSFGDANEAANIYPTAIGDPEGNPVAQTGWRASCMMAWNTSEGGPCFMRPTPTDAFDAPNPDKMAFQHCVKEIDADGKCVIDEKWGKRCESTTCDENNIEHGSKLAGASPEIVGPWHENATDQRWRHASGWNNQFAFPWEIGLYWNFTVGGVGQRAIGCPGLDKPFGTVDEPNWPHRTSNSPIFSSPAMNCSVNTYAPEDKPMHEIVDELASDNAYFAETFLEGWQMMASNGYTEGELVDGPQNGWIGHYSLTEQGVSREQIGDFEKYIEDNKPLTFTDKNVDPYICGHRGHAMVSCGNRFSEGLAQGFFVGPGDAGPGF